MCVARRRRWGGRGGGGGGGQPSAQKIKRGGRYLTLRPKAADFCSDRLRSDLPFLRTGVGQCTVMASTSSALTNVRATHMPMGNVLVSGPLFLSVFSIFSIDWLIDRLDDLLVG